MKIQFTIILIISISVCLACFIKLHSLVSSYYPILQQEKINKNDFLGRTTLDTLPNGTNSSLAEVTASTFVIKTSTNDTTKEASIIIPSLTAMERVVLYLHVGKTGGATTDKILRANCFYKRDKLRKKECLDSFPKNESLLSIVTPKAVHVQINPSVLDGEWVRNNVTSFLFTIRNPIDRAISSFNFDHPSNSPADELYIKHMRNIFYSKCFPTVEELASVLQGTNKRVDVPDFEKPEVVVTLDCFEIGNQTLRGEGHVLFNSHLSRNYEFYFRGSFQKYPEKEVFVIRTEGLWGDILSLNQALIDSMPATLLSNYENNSNKAFEEVEGFAKSHGSEKYEVTSGLSKKGREIFCCFLIDEIEIFEKLVRDALNINQIEKDKYLDKLYVDCGIPSEDITPGVSFSWKVWAVNSQTCSMSEP